MDRTKLAAELRRDEDVRLFPYVDQVGKTTIGAGRNLTDKGISLEEAELLLEHDIAEVVDELERRLPWWSTLDEVRQRVLANMAFNMGVQGLLGFRNTLALVQLGRYQEAAANMLLSKWAQQVGPRALRLSKMMEKGTT